MGSLRFDKKKLRIITKEATLKECSAWWNPPRPYRQWLVDPQCVLPVPALCRFKCTHQRSKIRGERGL